jgi:hypothetical protein
MKRNYTRQRTPVKPLDVDGQGTVTIDARDRLPHSIAFERGGQRFEIVGRDEDEHMNERGTA